MATLSISPRMAIRSLVIMVVLFCSAIILAKPAEATGYTCPNGWSSRTALPLSNVALFCYMPHSGGFLYDDVHIVKAYAFAVDQYTRDPNNPTDLFWYRGSILNQNPSFLKRSVKEHLQDYQPVGVRVVINGTFFNCTDGCPTSSTLSFPTWRVGLVNSGSDVSVPRRCFAWGGGQPLPQRFNWSHPNNLWLHVVGAGQTECGGQSDPYHRVVGLPPLYEVWNLGDPRTARTYIGRDVNTGGPPLICFLVGGYMTNQEARDHLNSFGCNNIVQMDGGTSSQLSYFDPITNAMESPVDGPLLGADRPVPHYFVIFD